MFRRNKSGKIMAAALLCLVLAGCGADKSSVESDISTQEEDGEGQEQEAGQGASSDTEGADADGGYRKGDSIGEQTFVVDLRPLEQVTFASYEPDVSENPFADAVFLIKKDDEVLMQLPGVNEDNVGEEIFEQVEAVSFLDYNYDDYDDIIMILRYRPGGDPAPGPSHSSVRYYSGTAAGSFLYEEQMSVNASEALAEITIQTAKDFIGAEGAAPEENEPGLEGLEPWQQAYIRYLTEESDPDGQQGYALIQISDTGIPQLAEVGIDEATGSRVVHYANGSVHVTQLNRLYFSYIPGSNLLCNSEGHMDYYYDYVFKLTDGEMVMIAAGTYGAADNSNVQLDEDGYPIYEYRWEGTEVSEEDYQKELAKVYDMSKAESCAYDDLVSVEEIKRAVAAYGK